MARGKERRQLRQLRRWAFADAAKDMDLSRLAFARLIKARDEEAVVALVAAARDEAIEVGIDWENIDWDQFFETLLKFIELFIKIFGMF